MVRELQRGFSNTRASIAAAHRTRVPVPLFTAEQPGALIAQRLLAGLLVALLEELGWIGFALPTLRRRLGPLSAGLWRGMVALVSRTRSDQRLQDLP